MPSIFLTPYQTGQRHDGPHHVPIAAQCAPRTHQPHQRLRRCTAKKGIVGTVVPDGFDFDRDVPLIDELAFRNELQILVGDPRPVAADDLVVAMPARIAINKAIELAIQFVAALSLERRALENAPGGLGERIEGSSARQAASFCCSRRVRTSRTTGPTSKDCCRTLSSSRIKSRRRGRHRRA